MFDLYAAAGLDPEETPSEEEQRASAAPVATVEAPNEIKKPEDDEILLMRNS